MLKYGGIFVYYGRLLILYVIIVYMVCYGDLLIYYIMLYVVWVVFLVSF